MLIVQKFGGSSVADSVRIAHVAEIIAQAYRQGSGVIAVLSAQGDTTDGLIEKALEINPEPPKRELDALLSVGEQISVSLMAMQLEKMGLPAVSLTGWQLGMFTDSTYGAARINAVDAGRVRRELDEGKIVIAAGFQGVNGTGDITTLGRGGSDTTAVAIAAAMKADRCQIYTDVEGIFTADPRLVPSAQKLESISYDEMLELASLGSQVLHNRSVELAKRHGVELEVLSSYVSSPGTIVGETGRHTHGPEVRGITRDTGTAHISVAGLGGETGAELEIFRALDRADISVDMISLSTDGISFTVAGADAGRACRALEECRARVGFDHAELNSHVSKVSVVGLGLLSSPGIAAALFEALYKAGINIRMISASELKASVLIDEEWTELAVAAIHEKLFGQ